MTLRERLDAFKATYAKWPASWPWLVQEQGHDVLYGVWVIGNDYRNRTRYYGAYPAGYLERVMALFPDVAQDVQDDRNHSHLLHVFSGSLPKGRYERCDLVQEAELRCSVYDLPAVILTGSRAWSSQTRRIQPPTRKSTARPWWTAAEYCKRSHA
jgi:hypothetical protein